MIDAASFSYPASVVRRRAPLNLLPGDEKCFSHEMVKCFPAVAALNLQDVIVYGDGLCSVGGRLPPTAALLEPAITLPLRQRIKTGLLIAARLMRSIPAARCERVEKGLLLTDAYFDGFFHWFGDILPKLEALRITRANISDHTILIPESKYATCAAESFAAYGLPCRVIPFGAAVFAEQLCFIPRLAPTGNYRTELMQGIRDVFRRRLSGGETGLRLYVSRKAAPKRHLINEESLAAVLARYGFTSVCMERLSFAEQVALAAECDVLVGLHGAGLVHMLWTRENTTVLEIRGAGDRRNNCYFSLASDLGHNYYYVSATRRSRFQPSFLSDYVIDVDRFEAALVQALGNNPVAGERSCVVPT
jgi:capsular polysaccharide biosynthesis protein